MNTPAAVTQLAVWSGAWWDVSPGPPVVGIWTSFCSAPFSLFLYPALPALLCVSFARAVQRIGKVRTTGGSLHGTAVPARIRPKARDASGRAAHINMSTRKHSTCERIRMCTHSMWHVI